jgi:hypothetical protein
MTKLPEPAEETWRNNARFFIYTSEQMLQFRRDALEEAAETCDSTMYIDGDGTVSKHGPMTHANVEIKKCADAIRALKEQIK